MTFRDTELKINELVNEFNLWLVRHYEDPKAHKEYYVNNVLLLAEEEVKTKIEDVLKAFVNGLNFPKFQFKQLEQEDYLVISSKLKLANAIASTENDYSKARTSILAKYQDYDLSELLAWTSDKTLTNGFNNRKSFNETVHAYKNNLLSAIKWENLNPTALPLGGYNSQYPLLKLNLSYELYNAEERVKAFNNEYQEL